MMKITRSGIGSATSIFLFAAMMVLASAPADAEPYLAVEKGLQCSACHTHAAGGGKRTVYGNVFTQTEMAARLATQDADMWTGQVTKWLGVGANLRGRFEYSDSDSEKARSEFDVTRGTVYVDANFLDGKLSLYVDQQVAPNSSFNREAYVLMKGTKLRLTAGQFYLPYGLRLQDDSAFVRRTTGINFDNPDRGLQLGYESGRWSSALSVTNGSGGGRETDTGKQLSAMTAYVMQRWRLGASVNFNDSDAGDRIMGNIFGGVRTGPVSWLFEIDAIRDELPGATDLDGIASIVEGNWRMKRGHNLKVSSEYFDPDSDLSEDHEVRWSALYEFTPLPFFQARFGVRSGDGPPATFGANRDVLFAEFHGFF